MLFILRPKQYWHGRNNVYNLEPMEGIKMYISLQNSIYFSYMFGCNKLESKNKNSLYLRQLFDGQKSSKNNREQIKQMMIKSYKMKCK